MKIAYVRVSTRGRLTIPLKFRTRMNLRRGDNLFEIKQTKPDTITLRKIGAKLRGAIEKAVKDADLAINRDKILRKLPEKVTRPTLNAALNYMERRGFILETKHGYIWTYNPNKNLARAEQEGLEV